MKLLEKSTGLFLPLKIDKNTFLIDVIALLHCTRSSLGICASSSGAIAGLVLWKVIYYTKDVRILINLLRKLAVNQLIVQLAQAVLIK